MAGEPKIMSEAAKAHRARPSAETTWARPSWLPTTTQPSAETAGLEVTGPRVS